MAATKVVDMTVDEFATAIANAVNGKSSSSFNRSNVGGGTAASSTTMSTLLADFGVGLSGILGHMKDFAGKAIEQTADTGDAVQMVGNTISKVLPSEIGATFKALGGFVSDSVRDWQQVSGLGLQMGGDAMAFRRAFSQTGMSVRDWAGMLETTKPAFSLLTGNISTGAEAFGKLSFQMQNSANSQEFLKLGMNAKDMNEVLAVTIQSQGIQRVQGANDRERMETFLASTAKLSREMDEQSKLTGMSRQEQLKNITEIQKEVQYRSAVLSFRQNNPNGEKILGDVNKASVGMGQEMQRALTMSLARNGAITQEMANDIQRTYGPAVLAQVIEIGRMGNSANEEVQKQATKATEALQMNMGEGLKEMSGLHKMGVGANTEMARQAYTQQYNRETSIAAYRQADDKRKNMTDAEIYAIIKEDIALQQEGRRLKDGVDANGVEYKRGDKDPTTLATDLTMEAQRQITLFGTNLNRVVDAMNTKLTSNPAVVQAGNDFLKSSRETGTVGDDKMEQSKLTSLTSSMLLKFDELNKEAKSSNEKILEEYKKVGKNLLDSLFGNVSKKADGTNPSKSGGSSWFQSGPQLSMWAEAGQREAIVNEGDASKFIMDNIGLVGNSGVNSPTMNSLLRNIPVQISSVKDQVSAQVEQAINSTTDQSQLVSALNEISTVMQATASTMREVARNTKDTATNIKAAGINIV